MRKMALFLAVALLFPMSGLPCPLVEQPLTFVVENSAYIARVRFLSIHEIAETLVARATVMEEVKGPLGVSTICVPVDFVVGVDGEAPRPDEAGWLFVGPGAGVQGTRRFWADVDAFREAAPLIEGQILFWIPFVEGKLALPAEIALPPGSDDSSDEPREGGWRLVASQTFMLSLAEAVAAQPDAVRP